MQVQQSGVSVNTELVNRLKIGGRWYGPGSVVAIDQNDAQILEMRGIVRKAKPGAKPLNVEEKPKVETPKVEEVSEPDKAEDTPPSETIKASMVPVQVKDTVDGPKPTHKRR